MAVSVRDKAGQVDQNGWLQAIRSGLQMYGKGRLIWHLIFVMWRLAAAMLLD